MEILILLLDFLGFLLYCLFIVPVAMYLVNASGTAKFLRSFNHPEHQKAWIPVYGSYLLAKELKRECNEEKFINEWAFSLGWLTFLIPGIGPIAFVAWIIYRVICLHKLAKEYGTEFSTVVSTLFMFHGIGCSILASEINKRRNLDRRPEYTVNKQQPINKRKFKVSKPKKVSEVKKQNTKSIIIDEVKSSKKDFINLSKEPEENKQ